MPKWWEQLKMTIFGQGSAPIAGSGSTASTHAEDAEKAYRVGQAVVEPAEMYWGKDPETFNSEVYANYLATSTGVYACATLRAENLATVPLRLYKGTSPEDRELVNSGRLFDLLKTVNPFWTLPFLIEMTDLALDLQGEAFWVLERGPSGRGVPEEIWWASPAHMRPRPHPIQYLSGFIFEFRGERLEFDPGEVVWFRNPNPIDEFEGLSPIAAARLSIDLDNAALRSNKGMFDNGMHLGGVISPAEKEMNWPQETVTGLENAVSRRFKGVDKAHKWMVLNQAMNVNPLGISPKDAEFLGLRKWSLADVCRVYKVSPILVQDLEHSTYSNFDQALKALFVLALMPQARRMEAWLNEQLLPLFPGEADVAEFDFSKVPVLQEAEDSKWTREQGQIKANAITINEWRKRQGLDKVPWGDGPAAQPAQAPQEDESLPPDDGSAKAAANRALAALKALQAKAIAFGSDEHQVAWKKFDRRATRHEERFKELVTGLLEQQREEIVGRLRRTEAEKSFGFKAIDPNQPFDPEVWRDLFRVAALKRIEEMVQDAGDATFDDLEVGISFDVKRPETAAFIQARAQRFAEEVNATTYDRLKASLVEATDAGETIDQIAARVEQVMGDRIRSSAETIARTETVSALTGGALEAAKASGVVTGKEWLAALDDRTRDTHIAAHEQYQGNPIPLDQDFEVGTARGPAPGNLDDVAETANCRCTLTFSVDEGGKAVRSRTLDALAAWARKGE